MGADRNPAIKVGHVVIDEPEAARRNRLADRLRRVGAVDAINGIAEVHGAGAERIAWTTGHEARQVGLPRDHFRRRAPIRPFGLPRNLQQALPGEAVAADADAVAQRVSLILYEIKMTLLRVDDDGAGRLQRAIEYELLLEFLWKLASELPWSMPGSTSGAVTGY